MPARGARLPCLLGSDGNLRVSEIWDFREQFEAFGERLTPVLAEAGIEFSGEPEVFAVHNIEKRYYRRTPSPLLTERAVLLEDARDLDPR